MGHIISHCHWRCQKLSVFHPWKFSMNIKLLTTNTSKVFSLEEKYDEHKWNYLLLVKLLHRYHQMHLCLNWCIFKQFLIKVTEIKYNRLKDK